MCPARALAPPPTPSAALPPVPKVHWLRTPAQTQGARLSLGVSSFLRGYPFSGSCPSSPKAQVSGQSLAPTLLVGRGLRSHQAPGCPWRCSPIPWRQGNKRLGAQRDLSGPTTAGWGEGARGAHLLSTPPALLILRDTFTGGNSQRSEEGNG